MPTISRLMGTGTPAEQAKAILGIPNTGNTATGTNQATAFPLVHSHTVFSTVASGTGAVLLASNAVSLTSQQGDLVRVTNGGANALLVYPPSGGNFVTLAANATISVPSGKTADLFCIGNNLWASSIGN